MKNVWVLVIVAAVVLVACPVFVALAQAAGGGGGGGGGRGAPVTVTDEQAKTLTPKVDALKTAATDLNTEAKKALGDTDGPRYTMQVVNQAVRDLNPPPADKAAATDTSGKGGKGGMGRTPITPTDAQLKTLQPKIDAVKAAAKALDTEAKKVLGDTDGPRYTMQSARQLGRDLNPGGGKGGA